MGILFSYLSNRLLDYPIKKKPICFYRQEDFTSTGEMIPRIERVRERSEPTRYDKIVDMFYTKLLSHRKHSHDMHEKNRKWSVEKVIQLFPGWDELTVANLHSLFLMFDKNMNGTLNFTDFWAVLESLGDDNSIETRQARFEETDTDMDGLINYDQFLSLVYNFNPPSDNGELTGLAKLCFDLSENIRFVSNLSVGEQLEYGLF